VPRRTFQATRQRVYRKGWVHARLVPDPTLLGLPYVGFALAQPYAEAIPDVTEAWRSLPGMVGLWTAGETLVAVRCWGQPTLPGAEDGLPLSGSATMRALYGFELDLRQRSVPIYFDYAAAWARAAGLSPAARYPIGWERRGSASARSREASGLPEPRALRTIAGVLGHEGPEAGEAADESLLDTALHRRRLGRCLAKGWVTPRCFLDPAAVHDSVDGLAERVAFVYATLDEGATPEGLLAELHGSAGISPFLYASDGRAVLFGVLAGGPRSDGSREPRGTRSAFDVVRGSASGIVIVREPLRSLTTVVGHRFDRLVDCLEPPVESAARPSARARPLERSRPASEGR
jgi:hypothetical protein